jgi:hypothetical protein
MKRSRASNIDAVRTRARIRPPMPRRRAVQGAASPAAPFVLIRGTGFTNENRPDMCQSRLATGRGGATVSGRHLWRRIRGVHLGSTFSRMP